MQFTWLGAKSLPITREEDWMRYTDEGVIRAEIEVCLKESAEYPTGDGVRLDRLRLRPSCRTVAVSRF